LELAQSLHPRAVNSHQEYTHQFSPCIPPAAEYYYFNIDNDDREDLTLPQYSQYIQINLAMIQMEASNMDN